MIASTAYECNFFERKKILENDFELSSSGKYSLSGFECVQNGESINHFPSMIFYSILKSLVSSGSNNWIFEHWVLIQEISIIKFLICFQSEAKWGNFLRAISISILVEQVNIRAIWAKFQAILGTPLRNCNFKCY